jgi:integrase
MKKRRMHIVPLSPQAVTLLRELHTLTGGREHLFPNLRRPNDCMSQTTLNRALEYMGFNGPNTIDFSAHGFRTTASTMLNECGFRADLIERQLAHMESNKTRAAYNHAEWLPERTAMMCQWADLIDGMVQGSNVVPMRAA